MENKLVAGTLFGAVLQTIHFYDMPILISLAAAIARFFYSEDTRKVSGFVKIWWMAFFICMMLLHGGKWLQLDYDLTVMIYGFSAFVAKEIFDVLLKVPSTIIPLIIMIRRNK